MFTTANRKLSRLKGKILAPFLDQSPAQRLIRQTARKEWKSIATNMGSGILVALSEGATIGVIFLAVGLLANPNDYERWQNSNLLAHLPVLQNWLGNASTTTLFVALMSLAVALQAINSLCRYINNVSGAYFGSRIMAKMSMKNNANQKPQYHKQHVYLLLLILDYSRGVYDEKIFFNFNYDNDNCFYQQFC